MERKDGTSNLDDYEVREVSFDDVKLADIPELIKQSGKINKKEIQMVYDRQYGYIRTPNSFHINAALRKQSVNTLPKQSQSTIQFMDQLMKENILKSNVRAYRYVDEEFLYSILEQNSEYFSSEQINQPQIIKVSKDNELSFNERGFTSVSLVDQLNVFSDIRPIKLIMDIPKNTNVFVTENYIESEMIIHKDAKYDIIDAKVEGNHLVIHLRLRE